MNAACKYQVALALLVQTIFIDVGLVYAQNQEPPDAAVPELARPSAVGESTLTLQQLVDAAATIHPSMLAARLEAAASTSDVAVAERQRWPSVSAVIESPLNSTNYSSPTRLLRVQQTLWDGGRNLARITDAKTLVEIGEIKIDLQRQQLAIQTVAAWQSLLSATERTRVAQKTIERLKIYQAQLQRRVSAEASPRIDLELADSRLLQTVVELNTAESAMKVALTRLEQLTGEKRLQHRIVRPEVKDDIAAADRFAGVMLQADWSLLASRHPAVSKARAEARQVRNRLSAKEAEKWPEIYMRVDQSFGQNTGTGGAPLTAYAGLNYAPSAGFSNALEAQSIATRIASQDQVVETAQREAYETFLTESEEFTSAQSRNAALVKATTGASLVLESYQRQFQAGRKTWQDLLNAVRELAQNEYALADTQATLIGAMRRLEVRMLKRPDAR